MMTKVIVFCADGIPCSLSYGKGNVLINGAKAPVIGRIFMDQIKEIYGQYLKAVILYGSYARGDYREDSDIG